MGMIDDSSGLRRQTSDIRGNKRDTRKSSSNHLQLLSCGISFSRSCVYSLSMPARRKGPAEKQQCDSADVKRHDLDMTRTNDDFAGKPGMLGPSPLIQISHPSR